MASVNLTNAKNTKNDEFYTQYYDIEKEVNAYLEFNPDVFKDKIILCPCDDPEWSNFTRYFAQNFEKLKLKKLISTSYAFKSKGVKGKYLITIFERKNPKFDKDKVEIKGKNFTLIEDRNKDNRIDINDLDYKYLEGDGDFRSEEVTKLRDEADIIVTNPPFSLFRGFLAWIVEAKKQFLIIGNINAITYKDVFPLIKNNKVWLGPSITSGDREFEVPKEIVDMNKFTGKIREGKYFQRVVGVRWFTNLEHGRRHLPIPLMEEAEIIKFVTKKPFKKYDNYEAIEVSLVKNIPKDYKGIMGVPISFLDKYNPNQFKILGSDYNVKEGMLPKLINPKWKGKMDRGYIDNQRIYTRIFIQHKI